MFTWLQTSKLATKKKQQMHGGCFPVLLQEQAVPADYPANYGAVY